MRTGGASGAIEGTVWLLGNPATRENAWRLVRTRWSEINARFPDTSIIRMLDPIKTAQSRLEFLRQLHDREALLPREQQRRFLASEGWIAWSGPAISELLKQFVAHNRMMTGGFAIHGDLVTLSDINCPVLAVIGEVDDIGQPASVRGIKRAAPRADAYEFCIRAGHFGLVVGSKAASQTWPTISAVVRFRLNPCCAVAQKVQSIAQPT